MYKVTRNINIENAQLRFRNFSGKEGKYNPEGRRNFCVLLDMDTAQKLSEDGWNIKYLQPREEGESPQAYIPIFVSYKFNPPKIVLISSSGKREINEDEVNILDWAEFANVDLVARPYNWEVNDKSGVKAYLKALYATIEEDEFEAKYRDVPDSAKGFFPEGEYGD